MPRAVAARDRAAGGLRAAWRRLAGMPRGLRLALVGVLIVAGFVAVVVPLFNSGGPPSAEISGSLPDRVATGRPVRVDIALDNVGASIIYPVCVAISGQGVSLQSANFQGLEQVGASHNLVCGGQLTGQETISITLVMTLDRPGAITVTLVPQQGAKVIGPPFSGSIAVG